jgi:TonB family protein
MAERNISGKATIDFFVETDGSVKVAKAIQFTDPQFEEAATECIRQWKFKPALKNGVPVRAELQVPIIFEPNQT